MEGKIFFTILGLLQAQLLTAILFGMMQETPYIEGIVAIIFALASILFIRNILRKEKQASLPAIFAFALGFINIVYLSFISSSLWLVIMLCLNAAGFILSLDVLVAQKRLVSTQGKFMRRKILLEKDVLQENKPAVIVYQDEAAHSITEPQKKRRTRRAKTKTAQKKVAKKKLTPRKKSRK